MAQAIGMALVNLGGATQIAAFGVAGAQLFVNAALINATVAMPAVGGHARRGISPQRLAADAACNANLHKGERA